MDMGGLGQKNGQWLLQLFDLSMAALPRLVNDEVKARITEPGQTHQGLYRKRNRRTPDGADGH